MLTFTGPFPGPQRQKDSNGSVHSSPCNVPNLDTRYGGWSIRLTHKIKNTRTAQKIYIVSGSIPVGPALTVPGNGTVNNFWIDITNRIIVNSESVDNPRSKPLQQDIRVIDQTEKNLLAFPGFQV